jgi:hypothetical protein
MKRGEAIMPHHRDTCSSLPRLREYRLAWLVVAPLLILTVPARSDPNLDEAPSGAVAQAVPAVTADAAAPPALTQAAVIVRPPEAKPQSDDQQRRVLMLLLMNSAGPVRPYGNLGR